MKTGNSDNEVHHSAVSKTGNHENICEEAANISGVSKQDVKEEIVENVKIEWFPDDNKMFSCDVCQEVFSEEVVLFIHKDLNHT